jgi:hypothetical protein
MIIKKKQLALFKKKQHTEMEFKDTWFNIISVTVLGVLLILFLWAVWSMKKSGTKEIPTWMFYLMFFFVVAHAALTLTVSFTEPDTLLDTTAVVKVA